MMLQQGNAKAAALPLVGLSSTSSPSFLCDSPSQTLRTVPQQTVGLSSPWVPSLPSLPLSTSFRDPEDVAREIVALWFFCRS